MPREGTKTEGIRRLCLGFLLIEIRYAPGGDENSYCMSDSVISSIEIRYAPGGDENGKKITFGDDELN